MKFDEINSLEEYFRPMRISDEDKRRRVELAESIEDAVLLFFAYFETLSEKGIGDRLHYVDYVYSLLEDATLKVTGTDEYLSKHLQDLSEQIVDTTIKNYKDSNTNGNGISSADASFSSEKHSFREPSETSSPSTTYNTTPLTNPLDEGGSPFPSNDNDNENGTSEDANTSNASNISYWLSDKRAVFIAETEANSILNYSDYMFAKFEGKTKKQWLTMLDEKVRPTHLDVDSRTVDIDDFFIVGFSIMRFPHDTEYGASAEEIINCRCSVRYF